MKNKYLLMAMMSLCLLSCNNAQESDLSISTVNESNDNYSLKQDEAFESVSEKEVIEMNWIFMNIESMKIEVELVSNNATKELISRLNERDIDLYLHEYGGFEKVGSLGFNLPRCDSQITTEAGDVVLYAGNQISIFYDSNSWSYTRLGKIKGLSKSEIKNVLGNGDISITLSIK